MHWSIVRGTIKSIRLKDDGKFRRLFLFWTVGSGYFQRKEIEKNRYYL